MYWATLVVERDSDRLLDGYAPQVLLEERMNLILSKVPGAAS